MVRRDRVGVRTKVAAALIALGAGVYVTAAGPSSADVTSVTGSATGYEAQISIFGGVQPHDGPTPTVTLLPDASNSPQSATAATGRVAHGPATFFTSGPITVSSQGSSGPAGSVMSSSDLTDIGSVDATGLSTTGESFFTNATGGPAPTAGGPGGGASSTCTASETGVTGSTTITNGFVQTDDGQGPGPRTFVAVPLNPPVGFSINGVVHPGGGAADSFTAVFNEQTTTAGALTVHAYHLIPTGPLATGDVFVGTSVCGVTASASTTTSTLPTTTTSTRVPSSTTTSSTRVPSSTTTSSTRVPSSTTTTSVPPGVITTGGGGTIGGGGTVIGGGNALVRTGAETPRITVLAAAALFLGFCLVRAARFRCYAAPWNRRGRW